MAVSKSVTLWKTDKSPVEKRVPLLVPFEQCIWNAGQASNHSAGGLPAPEEFFIKGFVEVSDETAKKIVTQYTWSPLTLNPLSIDKPTTPSIADSFFSANDFMESKDFMREHTKQSSFSKGRIILSPSTKIFYFDLQNL